MTLVTSLSETDAAPLETDTAPLETDADRLIEAFDRFRRDLEAQRRPAVMGSDPEALHDVRVAVRRTRSGLKHSEELLSRKTRRRFMREFSHLQDVTGPARDYEVWIAALQVDDPLRLVLAGYHDAARREAVDVLGSSHTKLLLAEWHAVLAGLPEASAAVSSEKSIGIQHERLMEAAASAGVDAEATDLHNMRKRVKELRYLLEIFDTDGERDRRKALRKLQDALGEVQDVAVQRAWLTEHAEEVGPIDVRLKELDERDTAGRVAYGELLAQFLTPAC